VFVGLSPVPVFVGSDLSARPPLTGLSGQPRLRQRKLTNTIATQHFLNIFPPLIDEIGSQRKQASKLFNSLRVRQEYSSSTAIENCEISFAE
jgi:hypothetical protein